MKRLLIISGLLVIAAAFAFSAGYITGMSDKEKAALFKQQWEQCLVELEAQMMACSTVKATP